jgi:hypothetical protein
MIGHRGHPEVEGTMGQVGGTMYLVEKTSMTWRSWKFPRGRTAPARGDGTAGLRDANHLVGRRCAGDRACADGPLSRRSSGRARTTSAMPRRTDRMPSRPWPARSMWSSWSARRTVRIPTACARWPQIGGIPAYLVDGAEQIDVCVAGHRYAGRRHGRRVGARNPGQWCRRADPGAGCRQRRDPGWRRREREFPVAERVAGLRRQAPGALPRVGGRRYNSHPFRTLL